MYVMGGIGVCECLVGSQHVVITGLQLWHVTYHTCVR